MNLETLNSMKRHDKVSYKGKSMYVANLSPQNPIYACYLTYRRDAGSKVTGVRWEDLGKLDKQI